MGIDCSWWVDIFAVSGTVNGLRLEDESESNADTGVLYEAVVYVPTGAWVTPLTKWWGDVVIEWGASVPRGLFWIEESVMYDVILETVIELVMSGSVSVAPAGYPVASSEWWLLWLRLWVLCALLSLFECEWVSLSSLAREEHGLSLGGRDSIGDM